MQAVDGLVGQTYTTAFQIDTLPPATSLTTSGPCALADDGLHTPDVQIISMAAQDSGSGVAGILYSNDGQNWLPYLQPVALRARHPRPFFYRSMDVAGNLEPVQQTALDGSPSCPF